MSKKSLANKSQIAPANYSALVAEIGSALQKGRNEAARQVNKILLHTYWSIGRYIVEYEQKGEDQAKYGDQLLEKLAKDLSLKYGKGFSRSNLFQIRKFYTTFPNIQTVSGQLASTKKKDTQLENIQTLSEQLSWSHYVELLKIEDSLERQFYIKQCAREKWSVRELKRQMQSMLFHRLSLSKQKEEIQALAQKGAEVKQAQDIIKDPYVFEFLGLPQQNRYLESDLENKLIQNLEKFLLELGKGFAFIGRQYKISISGRHFFVDLVFYHRILKCFVLIDLKRGEVEHEDIGQMNLYLNYFREEENQPEDNPPIGLVLGAYKDHILMEYATAHITNKLFVSRYQLYLPNKKELKRELEKLLGN
jgi:predicted nuclease of restriction endonuclease-like (RecB) superfamily